MIGLNWIGLYVSCVMFGCILSPESSVYLIDFMYKWRLAPCLVLCIDVPNTPNLFTLLSRDLRYKGRLAPCLGLKIDVPNTPKQYK